MNIKIVLMLILCINTAQARDHYQCFKNASKHYKIPLKYSLAIAFKESSYISKAKNSNNNGTRDVGYMQINSINKSLAKKYNYSWRKIRKNPCTNIWFGVRMIRHYMDRYKQVLWKAIGSYNVGTSNKKKANRRKRKYYNEVKKIIRTGIYKKYLYRLK